MLASVIDMKTFSCKTFKLLVCPLAFLLVGFVVLFFISRCIVHENDSSLFNGLTAITNAGILLTSIYALYYAIREYEKRLEEEKTRILCEYNQRYASDPNIASVINWILEISTFEDDNRIRKIDVNKASKHPSVYEKELFMRFFEELQMQIEKGTIEKYIVKEMFGFYAVKFSLHKELRSDIKDYEKDEWKGFREFVSLS